MQLLYFQFCGGKLSRCQSQMLSFRRCAAQTSFGGCGGRDRPELVEMQYRVEFIGAIACLAHRLVRIKVEGEHEGVESRES